MANQDAVRLDIEDSIATVLLNRPKALNAFNQEVFLGLQQTARSIRENPEVRVIIMTGAGDKAFSAGLDEFFPVSGRAMIPYMA
jgi:enoyl-CoA hydratase/carnithine racemase